MIMTTTTEKSEKKINTNIYEIMAEVNKSNSLNDELKEAICYNLERQDNEIKSLCYKLDKLENSTIKISHMEINDGKINKIILVGDNLTKY